MRLKIKMLLSDPKSPSKLARVAREDGLRASIERFQAEVLESRGDLKQAMSAYERAVRTAPSDGLAALGLARVRLQTGDAHGALHAADMALGIDPKDWEPHRIKADAYDALGEHEKSAREVEHAKELLVFSGFGQDDSSGGVI
jgi:Flp pilus assembly protein TadD